MLLIEALSLHEMPFSSPVTSDLLELFFSVRQSTNVVTDFTRKQFHIFCF